MKSLTKKILLITLTLTALVTAPISSASAADEMSPFDGPYMGAGLILNKSKTGTSVTPSATVTQNNNSKVAGGFYAGFGKQVEQLYFGVEGGFYLNGSPSPTASFGTTSTGLKSKNTFDLSARTGFVVDQALIYAVGGYTSTRYETTGLATTRKKRLGGFRYGGGIEFAITPQFSLRGEYTHANYKKWDVANGTNTIRFDPSEHRFLVGASVRF